MAKEKEQTELYEHLEKMLGSLRYGTITLVVQDGKVIQLEKNEKIRLK
ncbi:YezD family protein [Heliorestis acidaminivorans]|nr:YezD family protein [Heliorestis acidaminivorans]